MITNRWKSVALNVEPGHPRRNEAALIARQVAYTREITGKTEEIRASLDAAWGKNKKSLNEVMSDFMALIWHYFAFDNATYRFWYSVEDCIKNYFESRMYRNPVSDMTFAEEWQRFHYCKESSQKDVISVINNKSSFRAFFASHGLPVCHRLGIVEQHENVVIYRDNGGNVRNFEELWSNGRNAVFCKPALDCQGHGCILLEHDGDTCRINGAIVQKEKLADYFKEAKLVEEVLVNHPEIRKIHPLSLNTCRFITMQEDGGAIRIFRKVMRMGVGGSTVDNWCSGGLAVAIRDDGALCPTAVYEDYKKPDTNVHPDTGVVFSDVKIPYYQEAVDLVMQAHRLCPTMKSVGWDVAITPSGPVLVEGNVFYETFQAVCGGLRAEMLHYMLP